MPAVDLAQPRYAHLARPAFAEIDLRAHLLEHHAAHGELPRVRALRARFGGGNSRLVRIRQSVEVELGLRDAERSPRRTLHRLESVTARLTDLGKPPATDAAIEGLTQQVEALEARLERREAQLAKALAALHTLVERLEPTLSRRFRTLDDFIAERLDQAVARAESALATHAGAEPPPAWVRTAAASATAALDGRLQSLEETLRDQATLAQSALRAASEASRQVVAEGVTEITAAATSLSGLSRAHRQELGSTQLWIAALDDFLRRTHQRTQIEDQRAGALSATLVALAESQLAQVDVYEAGLVTLEALVMERLPQRPSHRRRRGR